MSYLGNRPILGAFSKLDSIAGSFNGATTSFPLTIGAAAVSGGVPTNMIISLNGVIQEPETDYTVSGTNIVFSVAPPTSSTFFGVKLGDLGTVAIPNDLSVTASKLDSALTAVIAAKELAANKNASGGYVGLNLYKINLPNNSNTFTSLLQNTNTAIRTYTMQDKSGTIAHTSDSRDAAAKTTLVDADEIVINDSAASFGVTRITYSNTKVAYKSYFDGIYGALATTNLFSAAQRGAFVTLTDAATVAIDMSLANQYNLRIAGNRTLGTPTNAVAGQQGIINIYQDPTGSRTLAYSFIYAWAGGTAGTLSTPGCTRDMLAYSVDAFNTGTVTITIATPGVGTLASHGFTNGHKVQLATTGALPTGLAVATTYWLRVIDANTFNFCTSLANVAAGTYIATTGSQSGVHTLTGGSIALALSKGFA